MAHDRRPRPSGRRRAIVLAGLLAGMASAALLTHTITPAPISSAT